MNTLHKEKCIAGHLIFTKFTKTSVTPSYTFVGSFGALPDYKTHLNLLPLLQTRKFYQLSRNYGHHDTRRNYTMYTTGRTLPEIISPTSTVTGSPKVSQSNRNPQNYFTIKEAEELIIVRQVAAANSHIE